MCKNNIHAHRAIDNFSNISKLQTFEGVHLNSGIWSGTICYWGTFVKVPIRAQTLESQMILFLLPKNASTNQRRADFGRTCDQPRCLSKIQIIKFRIVIARIRLVALVVGLRCIKSHRSQVQFSLGLTHLVRFCRLKCLAVDK